MYRALCLFAFVGAFSLVAAQSLHYTVYVSGSPGGTETFERSAAGDIDSSCELQIGSVKLKETLTAKLIGSKLISSDCQSHNPLGDSSVSYASGKVTVKSAKGSRTIDYLPTVALGANLIVPLWAEAMEQAAEQLDKEPDSNNVEVPVYLMDLGAQIPVLFRRLPARKALVDGKWHIVQAFQVNLAGTQAEIDRNEDLQIVAFDVPGQKLRFVLDGWTGLYDDPLAKYPELSQPTFVTKTESAVSMKTRDGITLVATIVRPDAPGTFPTILSRTPYDRGNGLLDAQFYAKRGYVYVSQDVRGRGASTGEWDPFVHEGPDGFDTIDWVTKQPWSDGSVGMIGGSYGGYVQWAAAVLQPKGLKCIVPQVSPPDAMHNLPYEFGVPFLYADLWWAKIVAGKSMDLSSFAAPLPHVEKMATLPLSATPSAVLGEQVPFMDKWLSRSNINDWKGFDFYQNLARANVPALQISGWFDGDGIGTKLIWAKERQLGRKDQWLIEGPWTHAFNTTSSIGKVDYGPSAIIDLDSLYLRWFDTWLKGKAVHLETVPKAQVFVTGLNEWQNLSDWPAPEEKVETLYLNGHGSANSRTLAAVPPSDGSESYTYDPKKDTATTILSKGRTQEDYDDVIDLKGISNGGYYLYKSAPVTQDTVIAGPAVVHLNFQTDAKDTDFFTSIVDVDEKGLPHGFGEPGKMRASYLGGVEKRIFLTPGKIYKADLQPWEFAHQIKAGHSIGVIIESTLFPLYARNLGTDEPIATGKKMVVQHNKILFGKSHPTSVTFQVMDVK